MVADNFQNPIQPRHRQNRVCSLAMSLALRACGFHGGNSRCSAVPQDLGLVRILRPGYELRNHAHTAQLTLMNYRHAVAERFGISQNVGLKKDGFAFVLQALDKITYLTPSYGI